MKFDCEFLFAALAEKHNAVIRKIREIPPWEWGNEFLGLEPQVLRLLGTFAKRHPECAAFRTAYTLASALAVYRLSSHKPKNLTEQERADCIAANRDLVEAIRTVATGGKYIAPEIQRIMADDPPLPALSPRQMEILESMVRGLSSRDIATQLGISHDMVREHSTQLFAKLGAANRTEAVAIALRKHLLKI